jgi:hypothetical protein
VPESCSKGWSINPGEDFAGVYGLAFFGQEAFDLSTFGRANFILHFHGFDDEESLSGFDGFTRGHQNANNFARHGRENFLAAFDFDGALPATAPGAGVDHLSGKFVGAALHFDRAIQGSREVNFEGLATEHYGDRVGRNLNGIAFYGTAIESDFALAVSLRQLNDMFGFAGRSGKFNLIFHGV